MDWLSGLIGSVFPLFEHLPFIRAALGIVLVFFLPGFAWTLVFFKEINVLERVVLSIGLSITLITLSMILLNQVFKVKLNGLNSFIDILALTAIALLIYYLRKTIWRRKKNAV